MVFRHPRDKDADFYARTAVEILPEVRVCVGEYHPDVFKRCHVDSISYSAGCANVISQKYRMVIRIFA